MTSKKIKDEAWPVYQNIGHLLKDDEVSYPAALFAMASMMMDIVVMGMGKTEPEARSYLMTLFTPADDDKH
jgi:hypothetical protein